MFNSVHERERKTKAEMLAALPDHEIVVKSSLPALNTLDYTNDKGVRRIVLHETNILSIFPDGEFKIDTRGYNTPLTRGRLNRFLPSSYSIFAEKGHMYLHTPKRGPVLFDKIIAIGPRGGIQSDTTEDKAASEKRKIDAYMDLYKRRGLPTAEESGGDPWVVLSTVTSCTMRDWMKTGYRFRRLYVLAYEWAGSTDTAIHFNLSDVDRKNGKLDNYAIQRIRRYVKYCLAH